MKFRDIPQFPTAGYVVNVSWTVLERRVGEDSDTRYGLILEPDYQRGHVWTTGQQMAYVEYGLMGGEKSMDITLNCPGWMDDWRGPYELVDGLQRVTAVRRFMAGEIRAFGYLISEFEDKMDYIRPSFEWRVLSLPTRAEVLKLYLLLNTGGVVHSAEEINRVKKLLEVEKS
jgi:hypothetical protein